MAFMDYAAISRTIAQQIQPLTYPSVSARTIRRLFQQSELSAEHPLLFLPLTGKHRHLRPQLGNKRRIWTMEWSDIVYTHEPRFCLQHPDGRIRMWRHRGSWYLCLVWRHIGGIPIITSNFDSQFPPLEKEAPEL
ncbi:transposable element Tc1 transposase [Trichonephila clavipes]|nr:transposable element Tc1 transposase [Trichonephila clavipes]